jgi:hypothetical protein
MVLAIMLFVGKRRFRATNARASYSLSANYQICVHYLFAALWFPILHILSAFFNIYAIIMVFVGKRQFCATNAPFLLLLARFFVCR